MGKGFDFFVLLMEGLRGQLALLEDIMSASASAPTVAVAAPAATSLPLLCFEVPDGSCW